MSSSSKTSPRLSAPATHELEVVIFGPGVGESILLHLGEGDWFVVDSCKYPGNPMPAAIDYLEKINVDPAHAIKRILATHWHDDHIRGMGDLVRRCPNAKFAMSAALAGEQFYQLVFEIDTQRKLVCGTSTASELADVLEQLANRGNKIAGPDLFAQDSSVLFSGGYKQSAQVRAVSPSAATMTNAMRDIAGKLLTTGHTRCFKRFEPNDLSVAAIVTAGCVNLLLGADLENSNDPAFGWKAVLASPFRPSIRSDMYKVAHHGSQNADHQEVWKSMLHADPIAVVTPYSKQRHPLPQSTDVARLHSQTKNLYCTTWPTSSRPKRRRGVDGIIKGAVKTRRTINKHRGYVRIRFDLFASVPQPVVTLFEAATQLW